MSAHGAAFGAHLTELIARRREEECVGNRRGPHPHQNAAAMMQYSPTSATPSAQMLSPSTVTNAVTMVASRWNGSFQMHAARIPDSPAHEPTGVGIVGSLQPFLDCQ